MRHLITTLFVMFIPTLAQAHYYFILPSEAGEPARLILSDNVALDQQVNPGEPEQFTLTPAARLAPGGAGYLTISGLPADGSMLTVTAAKRVSLTNYAEPTLVLHEARWQASPAPGQATSTGLAITCHSAAGGTVFAVTLAGKPLATRVTISSPAMKRPITVECGPDGLTRSLEEKGLLAARVSHLEMQSGEHQGQKYRQICHYSTLTTTVRE